MNNLHKATHDDPNELAGDNATKIDASGIESLAPSGYLAASGNSVGINLYLRNHVYSWQLDAARDRQPRASPRLLRGRLQNQVIWSRRAAGPDGKVESVSKETDSKGSGSREKASASSMMPPPDAFPARVNRLRKAKSTNNRSTAETRREEQAGVLREL